MGNNMRLRIGNHIVEVETINGVPTIKADAEEIKHPDGRVDVIVHVPCLVVGAKQQEIGGK